MGKILSKYDINIQGLEEKVHNFDFEGDDRFFGAFEQSFITKGNFKAIVRLNKNSALIQLNFDITATLELTCDRSLELFDEEVQVSEKYIYKFGDRHEEISDEIEMIPYGAATVNIAQHIFDFIGISLPMKKLHPRFRNEDIEEEGLLVYTSEKEEEPTDEPKEQEIDPRWAALGKLRMNN
ncbi:MAG: YceD family protein [Emticicia sp.]